MSKARCVGSSDAPADQVSEALLAQRAADNIRGKAAGIAQKVHGQEAGAEEANSKKFLFEIALIELLMGFMETARDGFVRLSTEVMAS